MNMIVYLYMACMISLMQSWHNWKDLLGSEAGIDTAANMKACI